MRATAWICILSVALMSCYTTTTIDPGGVERERMHVRTIKLVVTHDGMRYTFDEPKLAVIGDSLIIGVKDRKSVVIPISEARAVYVDEPDTGKTVLTLLGVAALIFVIGAVVVGVLFREDVKDVAK